MTGRVQTLRSSVAGNRPSGRQPGELYVNFPDMQLGVINPTSTAQDLLTVRMFSTTTTYVVGNYVLQGGFIYRAIAAVAAGAFNPAQWSQIGTQADLANYVLLAGGTMTGPLILSSDPSAALGAATKQYVDGGRYGDNRIINGDMRIDQRNAGAAGLAVGNTIDRWQYAAAQTNKISWKQGNAAAVQPFGFNYYLSAVSQSAYTSLAADTFAFTQKIEADMIGDFAWGTANAAPVTLSFWASATLGGTYSGSICNDTGTRSYPFIFVLPANLWTKFVITIPGDTAGTWVLLGNVLGMYLRFDLGCGATYRGPAGAWAATNYVGVTGAMSVVATANGLLNISNVKLEIGSVATPFNHQALAKSMVDCQRYFEMSYDYGAAPGTVTNNGFWQFVTNGLTSNSNLSTNVRFSTSKRAAPTVTIYSNATGAAGFVRNNIGTATDVAASALSMGQSGFVLSATGLVSAASINLTGHWTASAEL